MANESKVISDSRITNIWRCEDCTTKAKVPPSFYQDAGTPVCADCGEDMRYIETEVSADFSHRKVIRMFDPEADRYKFDFDTCTYSNGFAQIDTWQDASYFGVWTNPVQRAIVTYAEGDVTVVYNRTDEAYAEDLRDTLQAYSSTTRHAMIDMLFHKNRTDMIDVFVRLGFATRLH